MNREEFGKLYDSYVSPIYRFVLLRVGNTADAEDLTQHIFLKAWQNIHKYKKRKGIPFTSWLYRIAQNAVVDHYRTKKAHLDINSSTARNAIVEHFSSDSVEDKIAIQKVYRALEALTETERNVIIMRFVEELSVKEVAEALEKSQSSIRVTQYRGLKKLKQAIDDGHK